MLQVHARLLPADRKGFTGDRTWQEPFKTVWGFFFFFLFHQNQALPSGVQLQTAIDVARKSSSRLPAVFPGAPTRRPDTLGSSYSCTERSIALGRRHSKAAGDEVQENLDSVPSPNLALKDRKKKKKFCKIQSLFSPHSPLPVGFAFSSSRSEVPQRNIFLGDFLFRNLSLGALLALFYFIFNFLLGYRLKTGVSNQT